MFQIIKRVPLPSPQTNSSMDLTAIIMSKKAPVSSTEDSNILAAGDSYLSTVGSVAGGSNSNFKAQLLAFKDCISKGLSIDPVKRITANVILKDPFFHD